jgi:hypothetical protein
MPRRIRTVYRSSPMLTALRCPTCSAPLDAPTPGATFVSCRFCGATAQLGATPEAPPPAPIAARTAGPVVGNAGYNRDDAARFGDAFADATARGLGLVAALEDAAAAALARLGDQRAMMYAIAHVVTDFEAETGAQVRGDRVVITRVAEACYKVAVELRTTDATELNLPFLAATGAGPVHLLRTVTPADLARITASPPTVRAPAPPPAAPEPPKKKKGWFW